MIKKLLFLAMASASTLALTGCAEDPLPSLDKSSMGDGTSNKTGLGGYWWTYVDRGTTSSIDPDTGKVDPQAANSKDLKPGFSVGHGLDDDGTGNLAFHVKGAVGPTLSWPPPETALDPYWDAFYSGLCVDGKCLEYKYPSSGLGFGFKAKNAVLGTDAAGTKGVSFRIKLGATHGKAADGTTARPVSVSAPMDLTDAPDPSFEDQFGSKYVGLAGDNVPLCTFPGSKKADGTPQGSTSKTCFCNLTTGTKKPIPATDAWQTFCVAWTDFGDPGWGGLASLNPPVTALLPERVIKLQFDAYKPISGETAAAPFDFWVDDAKLLDEAGWTKCTTSGGKTL